MIHGTRADVHLLTEPLIANVAWFWGLASSQAEAAVLDLLIMHGESAGDSIVEDRYILASRKKGGRNWVLIFV